MNWLDISTWIFVWAANVICWWFLIVMWREYEVVIAISAICGFIVMRTMIMLGELLTKQLENSNVKED